MDAINCARIANNLGSNLTTIDSSGRRATYSTIIIPSDVNSLCTCGHSPGSSIQGSLQQPRQSIQSICYPNLPDHESTNQRDESQFTVIQINEEPVLYSPPMMASQLNQQLSRSVSESNLSQSNFNPSAGKSGNNQGCLRKSNSKSRVDSIKSVRFTLNPSYLVYSDTYYKLNDANDSKWFDHLASIKGDRGGKGNLYSTSRSSVTSDLNSVDPRGRMSHLAISRSRCKRSKNRSKYQRKKYLMHPSTVLLIIVLIVIVICILLARKRKKERITELNLFFALL